MLAATPDWRWRCVIIPLYSDHGIKLLIRHSTVTVSTVAFQWMSIFIFSNLAEFLNVCTVIYLCIQMYVSALMLWICVTHLCDRGPLAGVGSFLLQYRFWGGGGRAFACLRHLAGPKMILESQLLSLHIALRWHLCGAALLYFFLGPLCSLSGLLVSLQMGILMKTVFYCQAAVTSLNTCSCITPYRFFTFL